MIIDAHHRLGRPDRTGPGRHHRTAPGRHRAGAGPAPAGTGWSAWTPADLRPYVETAVDLFGTTRLMFGSDWPVLEVAATYAQVKDTMADLLGGLPADVFAGTAIDTYHLEIM